MAELTGEFGEAMKYLHTNAQKQGWTRVIEDTYKDGGSRLFIWARLSDQLEVVFVSVWSSAMAVGFHTGVMTDDKFGTISYSFQSRTRPFAHQGFILCPLLATADELTRSEVGDGVRFEIASRRCRDSRDEMILTRLPELAGYVQRKAPLLRGGRLWERGRDLVIEQSLPNSRLAFTFVSAEQRAEVLKRYPRELELEESVDSGCLIVDGRYLRRPYRVRLEGDRLTVNGVLFKDFKAESEGKPQWYRDSIDPVGEFESQVENLKADGVQIRAKESVTSTRRRDLGDRQEWVRAIDAIMRSDSAREDKAAALKGLPLLDGPDEFRELILDYWDGVD
jgi:hypothetical protein